MVPPKKATKMDLSSFLNDETFGSAWEENEVDLSKIALPVENAKANTIPLEELAAAKGNANQNFRGGSHLDPALGGGRSFERTEYPVPDRPPYRAIINNIPWDIKPEGVQAWVEDGLQKAGAVEEVDLPRSIKDPMRLKGIAFVTLKERESLVKTLTFNATKLNDRTVYVSVAAPRKDGFDWGGARGSNFQSSGDSVGDLDWGTARGSQFKGVRPPRDEPDLDWGTVRGSQFKGARPPKEEPDLDWGTVRGSQFRSARPPKEEPNLDWSSARGSHFQAPKSDSNKKGGKTFFQNGGAKKENDFDWGNVRNKAGKSPKSPRDAGPDLDWGSARGIHFGKKTGTSGNYGSAKLRKQIAENENVDDKPKIQTSRFGVLSTEDGDDDDEETVSKENVREQQIDQLEKDTQKLHVDDKEKDDWNVVGKK